MAPTTSTPVGLDQVLAASELDHQLVEGLDLTGRELGDKELVGCTFRNVKLGQARWKNTRLEDCVFEGCDLTAMVPDGAGLRDVRFERCKMLGVDWSRVNAHPVFAFSECNLSYASFVELVARKTQLLRCTLTEANFIGADLSGSSFAGSRLDGARFESCNLEKASFADTTGLLLDASKNRVRGAIVPVEAAVRLVESLGMKVG